MNDNLQTISWPGWETVGLIGRGSFGAVYEIQRDILGDIEKAALKVISIPQNPDDIEEMYGEGYDDESITATFHSHLKSIVAEYSLMRKMDGSANVVNCKDLRYIQHDDGIGWDIYIRMELLTPLMKALPIEISEATVIQIGKDLCNALVLCKKHEIVHRDIKPQNIFVSPNGDYKLGDFGIAKTVEKTMGGTKIGTYKYMAPEVYNNQPYGSAADIYSLGLVLYWLLNERRMPFLPLPPEKLKAGMDDAARQRRLSGEQLPLPANGSKRFKEIVLKACAYDPKDRYASAAEMKKDLEMLNAPAPAPVPVPKAEPVSAEEGQDDRTVSIFDRTKHLPAQELVQIAEDDKTEILKHPPVSAAPQTEPVAAQPYPQTPQAAKTYTVSAAPSLQSQEVKDKGAGEMESEKRKRRRLVIALAMVIVALLGGAAALLKESVTTVDPDAWKNNILMPDDLTFYPGQVSDYSQAIPDSVYQEAAFRSHISRESIKSISFLNTLKDMPRDAWDVSREQNRSVMAWLEKAPGDQSQRQMYKLYIAGEGGVAAPSNCDAMFAGYKNLEQIDFNDNFHTDYMERAVYMFYGCEKLKMLDVGSWNTSRITNTSAMFWDCNEMKIVDLSNWNTSRLTLTISMFAECIALESLDLSGWDTRNVRDMSVMFWRCTNLETLNLGDFETSKVQNYRDFMDDGRTYNGKVWQELFPVHEHVWEELRVFGTCQESVYAAMMCTICSLMDENTKVSMDISDHSYSETVIYPTKDDEGYTLHKCYVCGFSYKTDVMPALGYTPKLTLKSDSFVLVSDRLSRDNISVFDGPITKTDIIFTSSDVRIVTVNEQGVLGARNPGVATVTARYGDQIATCRVEVTVGDDDYLLWVEQGESASPLYFNGNASNDALLASPYFDEGTVVQVELNDGTGKYSVKFNEGEKVWYISLRVAENGGVKFEFTESPAWQFRWDSTYRTLIADIPELGGDYFIGTVGNETTMRAIPLADIQNANAAQLWWRP